MSDPRTDPEPERVVRLRQFMTVFGWAVAIALLFYFFASIKLLVLGVLAAASMAAALRPLAAYVPGPRGVAAVILGGSTILIAGGIVALASYLIAKPLGEELRSWPQVQERVNARLHDWGSGLGLEQPPTVQSLASQAADFFADGKGGEVVTTAANTLSGIAIALVFVFFGCIYLLAEPRRSLVDPVLPLLPPARRPQLCGAMDDLEPRLRWWLIGTLISMTVVGLASWGGFALVGVDFAVPLALLAGLSEIVPTIGPAAAFLVAVLFAATQGTGTMIGVVIVYLVIQTLESYVIVPMVMKEAVKIPPVVTLFTVVFWGKVFGIPGLLLAIPINLVIWSFVDHFLIRPRRAAEQRRADGG